MSALEEYRYASRWEGSASEVVAYHLADAAIAELKAKLERERDEVIAASECAKIEQRLRIEAEQRWTQCSLELERERAKRCETCRWDRNCAIQHAAEAGEWFYCKAWTEQEAKP